MTYLFYSPALHFDFLNFDDNIYITENSHVLSGLSLENIQWAFSTHHGGHWHPLTWVMHQIDVSLFGLNPTYHHGINILFHVGVTLLVFFLLIATRVQPLLATLITLLFTLHPLRIESVIWVTEKKDTLSLFLALSSLLMFYHYLRFKKRTSYALSLSLFILGLLAKPSIVVLPALMMLYFMTFHKKKLRTLLLSLIPFFILSALIALTTLWAQNQEGAIQQVSALKWNSHFGTIFIAFFTYLYKSIWPDPIAVFYPYKTFPIVYGLSAAILFFLLSFWIGIKKKQYPLITFIWVWFILSLLPIIGIIKVGGQFIADRWTYIPHVGLSLFLAAFINQLSGWKNKIALISLCFLITGYSTKTQIEIPNWKNSKTLFTHTLKVTQNNFLAHTNLGVALSQEGKLKEAQSQYEKALHIHPGYLEALNNLAGIHLKNRDLPNAKKNISKALKIRPKNYVTRYNLGLIEYNLGSPENALKEWVSVFLQSPSYPPVLKSLHFMHEHHRLILCSVKAEEKLKFFKDTKNKITAFTPESHTLNKLKILYNCVN